MKFDDPLTPFITCTLSTSSCFVGYPCFCNRRRKTTSTVILETNTPIILKTHNKIPYKNRFNMRMDFRWDVSIVSSTKQAVKYWPIAPFFLFARWSLLVFIECQDRSPPRTAFVLNYRCFNRNIHSWRKLDRSIIAFNQSWIQIVFSPIFYFKKLIVIQKLTRMEYKYTQFSKKRTTLVRIWLCASPFF